jgi:hypothetical protein
MCPAGTYSQSQGNDALDDCSKCSKGKYSPTSGAASSTACQSCPAGKYLDTEGNDAESDCTPCLAGKYSTAAGATATSTCQDCR